MSAEANVVGSIILASGPPPFLLIWSRVKGEGGETPKKGGVRGGGGFACFPGSLGCLSLLLELFDGAAAAAAAATWDGPPPSWAGGGRRPEKRPVGRDGAHKVYGPTKYRVVSLLLAVNAGNTKHWRALV